MEARLLVDDVCWCLNPILLYEVEVEVEVEVLLKVGDMAERKRVLMSLAGFPHVIHIVILQFYSHATELITDLVHAHKQLELGLRSTWN